MTRALSTLALLLAVSASLGACGDSENDAPPETAKPTRGAALLFAPGGFVERQPIDYAVDAVREAGYEPVVAEYPTGDLPGAVDYAERLARRHRGAAAIGFSAGGVLVADLAARDLVKRAVTVGAPSDLRRWDVNPSSLGYGGGATSQWQLVPATSRERWQASPSRLFEKLGPHPALLVMHSREDTLVPFSEGQELARLSHGKLEPAEGQHGTLQFEQATPRAVDWLTRG